MPRPAAAPVVPALHRDVVDRRGSEDGAARSASSSGSSARTIPTRRTSTWSATNPNHRRAGLGRALYERFFEDARARGARAGQGRHLARQPDLGRVPPRDGVPARRRPGHAAPVRHGRLPRLRRRRRGPGPLRPGPVGRTARLRPSTAAGVSCSWSSRPNRAGSIVGRDGVEPAPQERLALGVDEDVRPPERMLDELEALLGAPPAAMRPTVDAGSRGPPRASGRRRGAAARRCRGSPTGAPARGVSATIRSAASRAGGRIGGDRQAGPLEQLDEQVARPRRRGPRTPARGRPGPR